MKTVNPTQLLSQRLTEAYNWLNDALWESRLPPCLITGRATGSSLGYFAGERFAPAFLGGKAKKVFHEIALNLKHAGGDRTAAKVLSTLAHEMCHLEQHEFGRRPTRCYHDKQFEGYMMRVGLHPSNTGKPGGKTTGSQMTHYIIEGGPFDRAVERFLKRYGHDWLMQDVWLDAATRAKAKRKAKGGDGDGEGDGEGDAEPKSKGRIKFCCKGCQLNAWAKPTAKLRCDDCDRPLRPTEAATVGGDDDEA